MKFVSIETRKILTHARPIDRCQKVALFLREQSKLGESHSLATSPFYKGRYT